MSDSNKIQISYAPESDFGAKITTGNLQVLRHTGETLRQEQQTVRSNEIRSDRQVADYKRTHLSAAGEVNFEFSANTYDDLLQAVLQSAEFTTTRTASGIGVVAAASDKSFTATGLFQHFVVGQWVRISGFADTAAVNNGYAKIVTATNDKITVDKTLVDGTNAATSIVQGSIITNGVAAESYNLERLYTEDDKVALFTGMMLDQLDLTIASEQIITGSASFIGHKEYDLAASVAEGYIVAPTTEVMSSVDNLSLLSAAGEDASVAQFNLQIRNNLRGKSKVGTVGYFEVGSGTLEVTGNYTAYYIDSTLYKKYLSQEGIGLYFIIEDAAGNAYLVELPEVKLTTGSRSGGAIDTDIMSEHAFSAYRHPTLGYTIRITKW